MAKDKSFHDYVMRDLFREFAGITSRAMFGGWGIYKDGVIFAIIVEGELYFKVDESNKDDFAKAGSHPFEYSRKGQEIPIKMSYWLVPGEIMEDKNSLRQWIEKSIRASKSSK